MYQNVYENECGMRSWNKIIFCRISIPFAFFGAGLQNQQSHWQEFCHCKTLLLSLAKSRVALIIRTFLMWLNVSWRKEKKMTFKHQKPRWERRLMCWWLTSVALKSRKIFPFILLISLWNHESLIAFVGMGQFKFVFLLKLLERLCNKKKPYNTE